MKMKSVIAAAAAAEIKEYCRQAKAVFFAIFVVTFNVFCEETKLHMHIVFWLLSEEKKKKM